MNVSRMYRAVLVGVLMCRTALAQDNSLRSRLYVQAELTWYGTWPSTDLSNGLTRIAAIRQLGFGGTRLPVEWARIEPVRGVRNWQRVDSVVGELEANALQAYGVIAYSPKWAVPPEYVDVPRMDSQRPVLDGSAANGDTVFAQFCAAAARRYRGRIDRWEIWNEENHPSFWMHIVRDTNRGPDPLDYADLFHLASDSILAANPDAKVAVGGLTSMNGIPRSVLDPGTHVGLLAPYTPQDFIKGLVKAGVRPQAIALHPYSALPPGVTLGKSGVRVFPDLVVDSVLRQMDAGGLRTVEVGRERC